MQVPVSRRDQRSILIFRSPDAFNTNRELLILYVDAQCKRADRIDQWAGKPRA